MENFHNVTLTMFVCSRQPSVLAEDRRRWSSGLTYIHSCGYLQGKQATREGGRIKGCGGGRKRPRRHCGTRLRRHHRGGQTIQQEGGGAAAGREKKGRQWKTSENQSTFRWTYDPGVARSGVGRERGRV